MPVRSCRIRTARPGLVIRRDALAAVIPRPAYPGRAGSAALPVGRREEGGVLRIRLQPSRPVSLSQWW